MNGGKVFAPTRFGLDGLLGSPGTVDAPLPEQEAGRQSESVGGRGSVLEEKEKEIDSSMRNPADVLPRRFDTAYL